MSIVKLDFLLSYCIFMHFLNEIRGQALSFVFFDGNPKKQSGTSLRAIGTASILKESFPQIANIDHPHA